MNGNYDSLKTLVVFGLVFSKNQLVKNVFIFHECFLLFKIEFPFSDSSYPVIRRCKSMALGNLKASSCSGRSNLVNVAFNTGNGFVIIILLFWKLSAKVCMTTACLKCSI